MFSPGEADVLVHPSIPLSNLAKPMRTSVLRIATRLLGLINGNAAPRNAAVSGRRLCCEPLERRQMLAGTVLAEIMSAPFEVGYGEPADVTARILFTGDDDDGPWEVENLYLGDDDDGDSSNNASAANVFDHIASWPHESFILQQDTWYEFTFVDVPLGQFADDGDGVELFVWAEVNDNDSFPFLSNPVGASSNRQVFVDTPPPEARIVFLGPDPAQPPDDLIHFEGDSEAFGSNVAAWEWRSNLDGFLSDQEDFDLSSYELTVGTHTITFQVRHDSGNYSVLDQDSLTVRDAVPTAELSPIDPVSPGDLVSVTVNGFDNDERGERILEARLTVYNTGGPVPDELFVVSTPQMGLISFAAPTVPGTYTLGAEVLDDDGSWSPPVFGTFEVVPPPVPSADFDGDGDTDGADFLTWQAGYGAPTATRAIGDADNDKDVDADDLGTWEQQFGTAGGAAASNLLAASSQPISAATMDQALNAVVATDLIRLQTNTYWRAAVDHRRFDAEGPAVVSDGYTHSPEHSERFVDGLPHRSPAWLGCGTDVATSFQCRVTEGSPQEPNLRSLELAFEQVFSKLDKLFDA